ncbi:S41 family peptidase [Corynebacterium riegelii]|uniref:S41 family peptidase n=1 Tax=Corynebacterium riegelii TaxID=156976 RepID=UPI0023EFCA02|nr:S41 family peptidase [Corynebacterium riegelii]
MWTKKRVLTTIVAMLSALLLAVGAVAFVYGPTLTAMLTGTARFAGTQTPKRYSATVLALAEQGIYADSKEFEEAKARAKEAAKQADTLFDVYPALEDAVKAAGGKHSRLIEPGNPNLGWTMEEKSEASVSVEGRVAVATVPGVDRHDDVQGYADTLATGLASARDAGACGAVVDLRGNDGGDMGPMVAGLSSLLPDGTVLEFVSRTNTTQVTVEGNSVTGGGTPITTSGGKWDAPVAVLVDGDTASSGEATMLSFRGLEHSQSFGSPTAGYASANMVFDFPDGSLLMLTFAKDKARTGEEFAEDPVQPDIETETPLEEAKHWLSTEHGCN